MIGAILVAWLHYAAIVVMFSSLAGEHLLLKRQILAAQARTLQRLDLAYGLAAGLVVATGVARMFLEKGAAYYLGNAAFHALVGVFVIAGVLSIYPTRVFLRWRGDTREGLGQALAQPQFKRLTMIIRAELALLVLALLLATWMAHGGPTWAG